MAFITIGNNTLICEYLTPVFPLAVRGPNGAHQLSLRVKSYSNTTTTVHLLTVATFTAP